MMIATTMLPSIAQSRQPKYEPRYVSRPMTTFTYPAGTIPADQPQRLRLQIVASSAQPPEDESGLHEIKQTATACS